MFNPRSLSDVSLAEFVTVTMMSHIYFDILPSPSMSRFQRRASEIASLYEAQRTFLDWLGDFEAVDEPTVLLDMLEDCDETLPPETMELLGLPEGSSFSDAVAIIRSSWKA